MPDRKNVDFVLTYLLTVDLACTVFRKSLVDFEIDEEHEESRDEEGTGGRVNCITGKV